MNCTLQGCPGRYEAREVAQTFWQRGELLVVDHVPVDACRVCGDILLRVETVRRIEALLLQRSEPVTQVPLYDYPGRGGGRRTRSL